MSDDEVWEGKVLGGVGEGKAKREGARPPHVALDGGRPDKTTPGPNSHHRRQRKGRRWDPALTRTQAGPASMHERHGDRATRTEG